MDLNFTNLFRTRFCRGGTSVKNGTDCIGLAKEVLSLYGIDIEAVDPLEYSTKIISEVVQKEIESNKWEKLAVLEPGCILAFALDSFQPTMVQHVGVCIEGTKFIHILEKRGVCIHDLYGHRLDEKFFLGKFRGAYRWAG